MKMSIYEFYKEKYDLKKLNLKITDAKILFLIYDEEQYYYFKNDNFLSKSDNLDILDEINFLNSSYKLKIINFKEWIVIFWKSDKIFKKNKLRREK